MREYKLRDSDLAEVVAHVHQGAIDVLGPVVDPKTVHQSKFSMGTVLALIARNGRAGLAAFDAALGDQDVASLRGQFRMRSEERRVGQEGVSPCRSRGSRYH